MRYSALFLLLALLLPGQILRASVATSATLQIEAQRLDGSLVEGATFHVVDDSPAPTAITTDAQGRAYTVYTTHIAMSPPVVKSASEHLIVSSTFTSTRTSAGVVAIGHLTVIPADPANMTRDELLLHAHSTNVYLGDVAERWSREKGAPSELGKLRLASFLEGIRREGLVVALPHRDNDADPEREPAGIAVRVVDTYGNAVARRLVLLFGLDEETGELLVAASARTNSRGAAILHTPEAGRLYRVEVPEAGDDQIARGPVFISRDDLIGREQPVTMVLRDGRQVLSGLVFNGNRPAAGVLVETATPGSPVLSTRIDNSGFFSLGPLAGDEVRLALRRSANTEPVYFTAKLNGNEVFVPLDLLLMAQERR